MEMCVWCGTRPGNTKDHFIPQACGGLKTVPACSECNGARGIIVGKFGKLRRIITKKLGYRERVATRKWILRTNWDAVFDHQNKWEQIEISRFGYSPTAALNIRDMLQKAKEVLWIEKVIT